MYGSGEHMGVVKKTRGRKRANAGGVLMVDDLLRA